jgi:hypothetical protein
MQNRNRNIIISIFLVLDDVKNIRRGFFILFVQRYGEYVPSNAILNIPFGFLVEIELRGVFKTTFRVQKFRGFGESDCQIFFFFFFFFFFYSVGIHAPKV